MAKPCVYSLDGGKTWLSYKEFREHLLGNIDGYIKEKAIDENELSGKIKPLKNRANAVQEQSPTGVLQRPSEIPGSTGSERSGMEQVQQGKETTGEGVKEEEKITVGKKSYSPKTENGNLVFHDESGKVVSKRHPSGTKNKKYQELLDEYKKTYNYDQGKRSNEEGLEQGMSVEDVEDATIDNSENPAELAEVFVRTKDDTDGIKMDAIDEAIYNSLGKVKRSSYVRQSDENNISQQMAQSWFNNEKGLPVDEAAMKAESESGIEVTPQDIVDYINKYPSGHPSKKQIAGESKLAKKAAAKFKDITGFELDEETAKQIMDQEAKKINLKADEQYIDNLTDDEIERLVNERELSDAEVGKIFQKEEAGTTTETEGPKAPEAKKLKEELIDEEEQVDEAKKVSEEAVKRLETDIEALKQTSVEKVTIKRNAIIKRADDMVADGRINKRTANQFKKIAEQIHEAKREKRGEANQKKASDIADNLLDPPGTEGVIKKGVLPGVDKAIRHLLSHAADVVTSAQNHIDDINAAIDKGLEYIKQHPLYKQLLASGNIDEAVFEKEFRDTFKKETPVEKVEDHTGKETDDSEKFEDDESLNPEKKVRSVFRNFLKSVSKDGLKNAVKEIGVQYDIARMKETNETIAKIISQAKESDSLEDLEKMVLDKNSNLNIYDRGSLAIRLAKINSDAWNDAQTPKDKQRYQDKFKELYKIAAESATVSGQTANYVGKVNKLLFESDPLLVVNAIKEGVSERVDKLLGKKANKIKKVASEIEEAYKKTKKPVDEKIKKIRDERKNLFNKLKSIPLNSSKNGVTKLSTAPITDEHVKVLAEIALNYIQEGVVHISAITKNIRKDFFEAFGQYLSKSDVERVLSQKHGNETIKNISEKKSDERKKELGDVVETAFQKAKKENDQQEKLARESKKKQEKIEERVAKQDREEELSKEKEKTQSKQVAEKVVSAYRELEKDSEKEAPKEKKELPKGDVDAAKNIIEGAIGQDNDLTDMAKKELVKDIMHHLDVHGELSADDFKNYYGTAIGISKFTESDQIAVENALEIIREVDKIARKQIKQISDLEKLQQAKKEGKATNLELASIKELEKKIQNTTDEYFNTQSKAEYANRDVSKHFKDYNPYSVIASNIQLNLLSTISAIRNVVAYFPTAPIRFSRNALAAGLDLIRYKIALTSLGEKMNLEKSKNINLFKELKYGYRYGFWNGVLKTKNVLLKGNVDQSYMDRTSSYEYNSPKRFKEFWDIVKSDEKNKKIAKASLKLSEALLTFHPDMMSRLLAVGDLPVREKNRISAAVSLAAKDGLEGGALLKYVFDPTEEQAEKIKKESEHSSYQGDNLLSSGINKFVDGFINWVEKDGDRDGSTGIGFHVGGVMRVLKATTVPFTKTPANLVDETFEMMFPQYSIPKAMVFAVKGDTRRAERILANAAIGAVLKTAAYALFMAGGLGASAEEEDKEEKDVSRAAGKNPGEINYSMMMRYFSSVVTRDQDWGKKRSDDILIDYAKLGTTAMLMGTVANYYDRQETNGVNIKETNYISDMFKMMPIGLSTALNNSFLKATNDLQNAIMSKKGDKLDLFLSGQINALISSVYPNTAASASTSGQQYIKDPTTFKGIENRLKFDLSQKFFSGESLPNKIDIFGRKVLKTPNDENKYVYYMFNPIKSHSINTNTPEYKMYDFFDNIPQSNKDRFKAIPNQPLNEVNGYTLSGKDYEEYQAIVGKERYLGLSMYVNSPEWNTDNTEDKIKWLSYIWSEGIKNGREIFLGTHEGMRKVEKESESEENFKDEHSDLKEQLEELKPQEE